MEAQAHQSPQDPRIGMVLQDRYRILRKLGDGGMGSVYEGEHVSIKRRVAIKVLHSQFAQNPEIIARFHREAEAANSIGHPNIVEVTDMGRFPDGTAYMVLEFLLGRDWARDIDREGPQPLGKVVHILSQVCDALSAAHAKSIVHRDLKPENIYLIERGGDANFAKVLDFGISKIADASAENRSLTQTGTALGTPYYMAPEQCQGKKDLDARADIYSLGVILFQALTRQYPFDDESYPMLVLKICTEPPPPLAHYRPDLPPELHGILNRMLAKDRTQRYSTCAEVKAALEPFRHMNDAPVVTANAPSTASRGPSVLEGRVSSPVSTPTGTAYLPTSAAESVPEMAAVAPVEKRSSGMALAIVGMLIVLVLAGGSLGAAAAFGVFDRREQPDVRATSTPDPAPAGQAGAAAQARPAPTEVAQAPDSVPSTPSAPSTPVPATPPEPVATVRVQVDVVGPTSADITIDGVAYGSTPCSVEFPRDDPPGPGQAPRLREIVAQAPGFQTATLRVAFHEPVQRTISMERAPSGVGPRTGVRPTGVANVPTPAPTPVAAPMHTAPPPPPPIRSTPPPSSTRGGQPPLVGSGQLGI